MSLKEKYGKANPANKIRPTLKFALSSPAHAIALFFGAGCIHPAPGTWGTLAGLLVWIAMIPYLPREALLALIAMTWVLGAWASEKTSIDLGVHDAGCVVIDEVAAIWSVLILLPQNYVSWVMAFVFFRFFDIMKYPPANHFDQNMQNGWGIMLDDAVAAVWTVVAILIFDKAAGQLGYTLVGLLS